MKLILLCVFLFSFVSAREINPDSIYFRQNSKSFLTLTNAKLDLYRYAGAFEADSDVAFFGWISPSKLFYVKESDNPLYFVCIEYDVSKRSKRELFRYNGIVQSAKASQDGRFIAVKRMTREGYRKFTTEIIIRDLQKNVSDILYPKNPFSEFSFDNSSNLIYEKNGILEYNPFMRKERIILKKEKYSPGQNGSVSAYLSPSAAFLFLLAGGGGSYKASIYKNGSLYAEVEGVTSASEAGWLNENEVFFRRGGIGNYSLCAFSHSSRTYRNISPSSYNTASVFSRERVSFSVNGSAGYFDSLSSAVRMLPLDGEELSFSHDKNRFGVLFAKRLFITEISDVSTSEYRLKKMMMEISGIYKKTLEAESDWENSYASDYIKKKIEIYNTYNRENK